MAHAVRTVARKLGPKGSQPRPTAATSASDPQQSRDGRHSGCEGHRSSRSFQCLPPHAQRLAFGMARRRACRQHATGRRNSQVEQAQASLRRLMLRTARPPLAGRQRPFVSDPPHPARTLTAIPPAPGWKDLSAACPPTVLSCAFIEPAISAAETETTLLASSVSYGAATGTTPEAQRKQWLLHADRFALPRFLGPAGNQRHQQVK